MEYYEISAKITHEAVDAISQIFMDLGAKGTVIDDPELINHLRKYGGWQLTDIPEQKNTNIVTVTAYYPNDAAWQKVLENISQEFNLIEKRIGKFQFGNLIFRLVKETDWANEWKQFFHVTHVGKSFVIKPSWENYEIKNGEHLIEIDPGMAFGTGTHHTTNMCMTRLEKIVQKGNTVFDVGTGSGILAIAAALLGAEKIKAVDIDPVAVKVAKENVALNNLTDKISVQQGDLLHGTDGKADLIIANIIADIIIKLLPDIPQKLNANGVFLASGIIEDRIQNVENAANKNGLKLVAVDKRGGWAVMQFVLR